MNIAVEKNYESLTILFNDIPHVSFKLGEYIGFQSWYDSTNTMKIEIYFNNSVVILLGYSKKEVWEKVIKAIYENT